MPNKMKDWTNQKFGTLTAIQFSHRTDNHTYWLFRCDCGEEIYRVPRNVVNNKHPSCPSCLKGRGSWAWQGVGEFPQSHYRTIYHGAKAKNLEFSVSPEYLWDLFLVQNRRCVFTGWSLSFTESYNNKKSRTASLDRIDSSKGYVEGNVQWVHRDVNKLKKNMGDERFVELCLAVADHVER